MLSLAKFVGLPSQEWIILHPKLYADYNYMDCSQKTLPTLNTLFSQKGLNIRC